MPKDVGSSSSSSSIATVTPIVTVVPVTVEPKSYEFDCATCGVPWSFKINRSGPKRCYDCTELRRFLNGLLHRGVTIVDLKKRVNSILSEVD